MIKEESVLILVVMDYSLVQMKMEMRNRQITVLILVVMDYSLVPLTLQRLLCQKTVLILVVMDYSLVLTSYLLNCQISNES